MQNWGVVGMKQDGKPGKKRERHKGPARCPFFKQYYVGVCSGHIFPYAPSLEEKKEFCLSQEFSACLIYEQNFSADSPQQK
jgi:hypothetical protein